MNFYFFKNIIVGLSNLHNLIYYFRLNNAENALFYSFSR